MSLMQRRLAARRAKARAARAAQSPIILAAAAGSQFKDLERQLAKHECADCKGEFEVNTATLEAPFCIHCGSVNTKAAKLAAQAANTVRHAAPEEADVTAVQCANKDCGALNVFGNETLSALKTFHCVTCGTHLSPKLEACDDMGTDPLLEDKPAPGATDPSADPAGDANSADDKPPVADPVVEDAPPAADPVVDGAPPAAGEDPAGPDADDNADVDVMEVDMCDMLDGPVTQGEPVESEMLMTEDAAYIQAGGKFVAVLHKSEAGDNKDIFGTDAFPEAVATILKKEGLRAAMAAFGFKSIKLKVNVKANVNKLVEAGLASAKASIEASNKGRDEAFAQCLSISILGHATGYFADVENALAGELVAALEELNVRGAKKVVATVLAKTAKPYATSVVAKAVDLLGRDVNYRNDIAANLDKLNPQATAAQDDEETDITARLEATARRVEQTATVVQPQGGRGQQRVAALLASRRSMSPYGG